MKHLSLIFFIVQTSFLFAQNVKLVLENNSAPIFYDEMLQQFVVIDDSTFYTTYDNEKKMWKRVPLKSFHLGSFKNFIETYVPLPRTKNTTLFINDGCGIVYEFKNGVIQRIDCSFEHKNQFGGTHFIKDDEPHIVFGYGLFSFKNFITRFDIENREWYKKIVSGNKPEPRKWATSVLENNSLYIFGGLGELDEIDRSLRDCWKFNFQKNKWVCLGKLNPLIPSYFPYRFKGKITCHEKHPSFFVNPERIFRFYPSKNKVRIYVLQNVGKYVAIRSSRNLLLLSEVEHEHDKISLIISDQKSFFKSLVYEDYKIWELTSPSRVKSGAIYIFLTCFGLLSLIVIWFYKKYTTQKKEAIFGNLLLTELELEFIGLFLKFDNKGIEIHQINDLINYGNPSIDTLKKRKEQLLKDIKLKLSRHFKIDFHQIFIEERMNSDKRMKIMFLHPEIFKVLRNFKSTDE